MLKRVLIANRGEIARRIARTCARLGIEYVAVYSSADIDAEHLFGAVARVDIGPAPATQSYLDIEALVDAAVRHGCDAVHPGYGFLSENPRFARRVVEAGLVFIGPRPETIESMGDKATARALMAAAGVPVLPGSEQATESVPDLAADAERIGFPLILKPAAGGGGKGMRVVTDPAELAVAAAEAIRLGRAAFGDGRVLAERYLPRPRHIEVQVFGDENGDVVHLFDRDCSLQRRHQKIVEEAPALGLDPAVRAAMLEAAVRGAKSLGYLNAGTFEFILGPDGEFAFLEVNTRLQVEHPVTEEITGLDLVEWQLRVAAGEPLPLAQHEITSSGHAIECRIYAEDPDAGFRPAPGRALLTRWPESVRVEAAFDTEGSAPEHYDPLVAKLVAHAADRPAALRSLREALTTTVVLGLTTNQGFLSRLLAKPRVVAGSTDTHLVDRVVGDGGFALTLPAIACAVVIASLGATRVTSPWLGTLGPVDRGALDPAMPLGKITVRHGERDWTAGIVRRSANTLSVTVGEAVFDVSGEERNGLWQGRVGPHRWTGLRTSAGYELSLDGHRVALADAAHGAAAAQDTEGELRSNLPGTVVALPHVPGHRVEAGETIVVIEAMKMEHRLVAPVAATIASIDCSLNQPVAAGQVLAVLEPHDARDAEPMPASAAEGKTRD